MKIALLWMTGLYTAILAFGLWKAFHIKSYHGADTLFDATLPFYEINRDLLARFFSFSLSYIDIFLYQDREKYWVLMAAVSLFEFIMVAAMAYFLLVSLPKMSLRRRR